MQVREIHRPKTGKSAATDAAGCRGMEFWHEEDDGDVGHEIEPKAIHRKQHQLSAQAEL